MRFLSSKKFLAAVVVAACACEGEVSAVFDDEGAVAEDAGATDGGRRFDAAIQTDAGPRFDAGSVADAGDEPDAGFEGDAGGETPFDGGPSVPTVPLSQRLAAATATAEGHPFCATMPPFYWEIGDASGARVSGGSYAPNTPLSIASASKWIYSTYFVQRVNGVLSADDIKFFNFWSGYSNFTQCGTALTVEACLLQGTNDVKDAETENKFAYGGGHMQKHAALNGLGAMTTAQFAYEMRSHIGTDIELSYSSPQPAGGATMSPANYGKMLRKIVNGTMVMKSVLGTHSVCTDPFTCPAAVNTPAPKGEAWHYSIGHWVEDDPTVGDGAFSSAGAFGFYPWVDKTKTWYGIIAPLSALSPISSIKCGREIRAAWVSGLARTNVMQ